MTTSYFFNYNFKQLHHNMTLKKKQKNPNIKIRPHRERLNSRKKILLKRSYLITDVTYAVDLDALKVVVLLPVVDQAPFCQALFHVLHQHPRYAWKNTLSSVFFQKYFTGFFSSFFFLAAVNVLFPYIFYCYSKYIHSFSFLEHSFSHT